MVLVTVWEITKIRLWFLMFIFIAMRSGTHTHILTCIFVNMCYVYYCIHIDILPPALMGVIQVVFC